MDGSPPSSPKRRRHQRDDMYEFQKYIGRGGFAIVELWRKRWDDEALVVAKRIHLAEMTAEEEEKTRAESLFLKSLRHPHIVRYSGSWVNKETNDLLIIQEYCSGGDLAQFIKDTIPKRQLIASDKVLRWLAQLAHALLYCHKDRKILHRDLKPSNVFLVEGGDDIRLGDFGVATILSSTQSLCGTVIGTQVYMSPEILRMQKYGLKSDVWGLGVIMYELCTLRRPFDMTDPIAAIRSIVASGGPPPFPRVPGGGSAYPAEVEACCFAMLNKDTGDRPTLSQLLLEHKCLRTVVLDVERRIDWKESLVPVPSDPLGRIEEEQFPESAPVGMEDEEGDDEDKPEQAEQESKAAADTSTPSMVAKYKDQSEYDMVLEAFDRFDLNGDGMIDCKELGDVLTGLDAEMWNSSAIQELFKSIDLNSNERIEWDEWLKWVFESDRGRSYRDKLKSDAETMKAPMQSSAHAAKASSDSGQQRDAAAKKGGGLSKFAEESRARLLGGSTVAAGSVASSRSARIYEKSPAAAPVEAAVERNGDSVAEGCRALSSPRSALIAAAEISDIRELTVRQKELRTLLSSVPEYAPRTVEDDLEANEDDDEDSCFQPLDTGVRPQTAAPPGMPPADMAARPKATACAAGLAPPGMPPLQRAVTAGPAPPGMPPLQRAVTAPGTQAEKENSSCWTCPFCDEPNKLRTHCNNCGKARPEEECMSPSNWTCPICDEPNKNRKQCNNCGAPSPSSRTTAPRSEADSGMDSRSLSPATRPTKSPEHQECEPAGFTFNTEKDHLTRKVAVIDARLRCIEALQAPGDPDPVELNHTLRQARELELGREDCGRAILAHTTRLCVKAEDTIAKPDAPLPAIEHSAELLETVQTEAQVPTKVVERANERLQKKQEEQKQLGLRCICGPIVRRVSVQREEILSKVKAQIARRWGRSEDALVLQFRQGGASFALDTEAQWQDCIRVHPNTPVEVVVNMLKKAPLARAARPKRTLQSMAARSKAGANKTAPSRTGRGGGANASSLPVSRGARR